MTKSISFRRKLFLYYFGIFLLFTVLILAFQYHREKDIKIAALDNRLNDMAQLVDNYDWLRDQIVEQAASSQAFFTS